LFFTALQSIIDKWISAEQSGIMFVFYEIEATDVGRLSHRILCISWRRCIYNTQFIVAVHQTAVSREFLRQSFLKIF
jgi:hypothetical protein